MIKKYLIFLSQLWVLLFFTAVIFPKQVSSKPTKKETKAWFKIEKSSTLEKQVQLSEKFLKKFPHSSMLPNIYYILARSYLEKGMMSQFENHAEKSLGGAPQNPHLLITLAVQYSERAETERAISRAEEGLQLLLPMPTPAKASERSWALVKDQLLADAHYALGLAYLHESTRIRGHRRTARKAKLSEAVEQLMQAVQLDPEHDRAYYRLGFVLNQQNNLDDSTINYARSAAINGMTSTLARAKLKVLINTYLPDQDVEIIISQQYQHVYEKIQERDSLLKEFSHVVDNTKDQRQKLLSLIGSGKYSHLEGNSGAVYSHSGGSRAMGRSSAGVTRGGQSDGFVRGLKESLEAKPKKVLEIENPADKKQLSVQVRQKLGTVKSELEAVHKVRTTMLVLIDAGKNTRSTKKKWKNQLKILRNRADELRDVLIRIFPSLRRKSRSKLQLSNIATKTNYKQEIEFIENELTQAEDQIHDRIFGKVQVISVPALHENMLTHLDRVKKMADLIRRDL